jgi:hypothetical protein
MILYSKEKKKKKKLLFKTSKWIHKYVGLVLVLFLLWMSTSGILLNHPKAISSFSIPHWAIPSHYIPKNWNRSTLTHLIYSKQIDNLVFASGKSGVWKSVDGGYTFVKCMKGDYPESTFYRKTNHIYLHETPKKSWLYAGNDFGLFKMNLSDEKWIQIPLEVSPNKIIKFIKKGNGLLALSDFDIYSIEFSSNEHSIVKNNIRQKHIKEKKPLVDFFFELHSGKLFGFSGQIIFDLAGLVLIYLSITAFYTWAYPKKRRKDKELERAQKNPIGRKVFQFLLKYHLSLGIWFAVFLFVFGITGFFMRPPFLAILIDKEINLPSIINHRHDISWAGKIHNGMILKNTNNLVLATSDGLWQGSVEEDAVFQEISQDWPIFVMGATVLESIDTSKVMVGSFSGLYEISSKKLDLMTGEIIENQSSIRPGKFMITGYVESPEKEFFVFTHEQGILPLPGNELKGRFQQPNSISENYKMPLWNYVFEIHNGRFFKGILGDWYILLLPIGSLLFVMITLTGIMDWFFHKRKQSTNSTKR